MCESAQARNEVYDFIIKHITSVPQLEALLLLWQQRPRPWLPADVAQRLYIGLELADAALKDLTRRGLIVSLPPPAGYCYQSTSKDLDRILSALEETYRREVVLVSNIIHSKPVQ